MRLWNQDADIKRFLKDFGAARGVTNAFEDSVRFKYS